ncbi:MAG: glutathione peroxidase, partial [Prevotella salivae]|nr:glutathione peroxidase [Segatella salivae]
HEIALYSYLKREQGFRGFGVGTMAEAMDKMLKKQDALYASNSDIKWNFTKFLVSREGKVIARFEPTDDMDMVEKCIVEALHK